MIGTSIARYEILEEIGRGGMSVVYLARDTSLNRKVAVKVLHEHLARTPENRERFRREAEATARLQHPNILDVYDVSQESDERSFIVMEYIRGKNLRQFIEDHPPPPPEAAAFIAVEICDALAHAHHQGIIHRDLKPGNVMISEAGDIKLMDFGIAHVIDFDTMTKTGSLMGSPAHMAPEIIDGEGVDERADVFALGTVLYWMITGALPFRGENAPQVIRNVMEGRFDPPELLEPAINHDLARIINRALNESPDDRFATALTVKRELLAAVHALGYEDEDRMARRYFADPEGFSENFEADIVPRLVACAERAIDRRSISTAIAYFNRVLAYDPDNEKVQRALDKLDRNRRLVRAATGAAALVALAALGWMVMRALDEPEPIAQTSGASQAVEEAVARADAAPRAIASAEPRVETAGAVAEARLTQVAAASAARRVEATAEVISNDVAEETTDGAATVKPPRLEADPVELDDEDEASDEEREDDGEAEDDDSDPKPPTHKISFRVYPPSAKLSIDGEPVDMWYKGVELTEGTHTIEAEAPGCEPLRREIEIDGPREEKIPVVLDWKEARIEVVSNKSALVFLGDDSDVHSRGMRNTVSIDFAREQPPSRTVRLRIADRENPRVVEERKLTVQPGEEHTLNVNF
ncbi:MAG: serine/threonine-protein kinase [Persicimonas sp.]